MQVYPEDEILKTQLTMLSRTKLVDFEIEKYKLLHKSESAGTSLSFQWLCPSAASACNCSSENN
jgi:hypothetical protein